MRATVIHGPGDVRIEERDKPTIVDPTDAIIKLAATCVLMTHRVRLVGGVGAAEGPQVGAAHR